MNQPNQTSIEADPVHEKDSEKMEKKRNEIEVVNLEIEVLRSIFVVQSAFNFS
jgi:hypothetical protein